MKNITEIFGTGYHPVKTIVIYKTKTRDKNSYVQAFDFDENGRPVNAHPLNNKECHTFAKVFNSLADQKTTYLKSKGLMPKNIIYINHDQNGYVIWHTPVMKADLLFKDLDLPSGNAYVPALLWKASKDSLSIYAITESADITQDTPLYHAPFFNLYRQGKVCMGSVQINIPKDCMLEDFIARWEVYFFNSYFSHLIDGHNPINGNLHQLWKQLINRNKKFPVQHLVKTGSTIKNLLQ
ncbi:PRTRC system protein B [Pedobacter sp. WC2423]|uniref:PRTRC system protein B n=1 Tax=Pedobacter sp. WC2423 TaxID=3234142 RepID=UPI003466E99D